MSNQLSGPIHQFLSSFNARDGDRTASISTEKETKKNLIVEFLNHLKDNYAEPVVGINGAFQLTQLYDKAMVYELFLYGTTSHDPGEHNLKRLTTKVTNTIF